LRVVDTFLLDIDLVHCYSQSASQSEVRLCASDHCFGNESAVFNANWQMPCSGRLERQRCRGRCSVTQLRRLNWRRVRRRRHSNSWAVKARRRRVERLALLRNRPDINGDW